ncbi:STAS domain-containing protein [Paraconexibacter antarcticus]|uniref:STAS domain-containing protein n=1 Tax=Paraconexibacter antarcticus TaxID=2949664 RepID=A0ABY5E035_9ACTN|nr:STAS domain-containing protein [Paraconexibacter antarcticus]UTI66841.1 STAS domain-containing protein [Paraconexibacter antarcticus]
MTTPTPSPADALLSAVLLEDSAVLLTAWAAALDRQFAGARDVADAERECGRLLTAVGRELRADPAIPPRGSTRWEPLRDVLVELSRDCAQAGLSPSETATLVFLLKQPLFDRLRERAAESAGGAEGLTDALWAATTFVDELGLESFDAYLRSREDIIRRQQDELLELSTPVVKLWTGILAVPLIGTLDSARTQVVMESLLEKIIETDAPMAIIDITGVPTVDTLVAQHLLKTVAAARLMGADCIISGIRPQIAQTIVHLGLDLSDVTTKASLADALRVALDRSGYEVRKIGRPA